MACVETGGTEARLELLRKKIVCPSQQHALGVRMKSWEYILQRLVQCNLN